MILLPLTQMVFPNQYYIVHQIHPILMNYCLCRGAFVHQPACSIAPSPCNCNLDNKLNELFDSSFTKGFESNDEIKKKFKTNYKLREIDFETKAEKLLKIITTNSLSRSFLILGRTKATPKFGPVSRKRSTYIGVMKNRNNWQAFITVNNIKRYIGSYKTEKEAAIAFDFYCILQHSLFAKTNFDYTKDSVIMMITSFMQNNGYFKPKDEYLQV